MLARAGTRHGCSTSSCSTAFASVRTGQLSEDRAADARSDFAALAITRYEHTLVADRVWELRHGLTAHDATFVALAELLGVPLVTCDARLADAPGNRAVTELYEAAGG